MALEELIEIYKINSSTMNLCRIDEILLNDGLGKKILFSTLFSWEKMFQDHSIPTDMVLMNIRKITPTADSA